jgi:hypothetical protein
MPAWAVIAVGYLAASVLVGWAVARMGRREAQPEEDQAAPRLVAPGDLERLWNAPARDPRSVE